MCAHHLSGTQIRIVPFSAGLAHGAHREHSTGASAQCHHVARSALQVRTAVSQNPSCVRSGCKYRRSPLHS